jgi:hypothetical protein
MKVIDIHSKSTDPVAKGLSNFAHRPFKLGPYTFASMESFLQCLKTADSVVITKRCRLIGYAAFKDGQKDNAWKNIQILYWLGYSYQRDSNGYQELLKLAYDAQFDQNPDFAELLLKTVGRQLRHTMGKHDARDTTLTESEYIQQLERLRWRALLAAARN